MIGAAIGIAGSIAGSIMSGNANKKADALLQKQIEENQAFYNNNVNRTYLETNAAKGVLERLRKQYDQANRIAENKGVITGSSDEAVLAAKSQNNEALNDATSQIAEQATAFQQNQENQYRQTANNLAGVQVGLAANKAQSGANLVSNAGQAFSSMGSGSDNPLSKLFGKKDKTGTNTVTV